MDVLNYGDKVTCLTKLKIKGKEYSPGDNLPYEREGVDFWLVQTLCKQKRLILSSELSPERLEKLKQPKVSKIIKNYGGGLRVAVSWPPNEPLPDGVIMAEPLSAAQSPAPPPGIEEVQEEQEIEEVQEEEVQEEEVQEEEVELSSLGSGYYNVLVDGKPINEKKLRKKEAKELMEAYISS